MIQKENKVRDTKIKKHNDKSREKIASNMVQKNMETREGMAKIKEYESEQSVVNQKVRENIDKKVGEILSYNGMLNQKRREN